ncbi:WD repeat-containing protein 82-B-like isoform X1 [Hibiscus syriacus]|uniref:WD repeat-containing protein 82-B-like isoform X1 n=1 Tax=Hibiscus syriacus TaxID=106335 RepID=A0A6A3BM01_HIBSY|nr:WD repeat-containing protein 82-B-like isoform X1 [Hibiscus syriacus]
MTEISASRSLRLLLFFASVPLLFISGFCDDSKDLKNNSKTKSDVVSNTRAKVVLILLALVAVGLFSFFLFKLWQKKKRDEQYARLLKLFEEDDELELELGLRD